MWKLVDPHDPSAWLEHLSRHCRWYSQKKGAGMEGSTAQSGTKKAGKTAITLNMGGHVQLAKELVDHNG